MLSYEEYLIEVVILSNAVNEASEKLQHYPRGEMGLTPQHVRESKEFILDKKLFNSHMKTSQDFNRKYSKFGKQRAMAKRKARNNLTQV